MIDNNIREMPSNLLNINTTHNEFHLTANLSQTGRSAKERFNEFFAANIRNPNTRTAYFSAAKDFIAWITDQGITDLEQIKPIHVATWVEWLKSQYATPSVKQKLAGVKMLLDWMVTGHIISTNPATSVKSPRYSVWKGKTPVLSPEEVRLLLNAIDTTTISGLRDRALIGLMVYTFARIGAALSMTVEDVFIQNRRLWVRLHEKGGKLHDMPCHHELEEWLSSYIEGCNLKDNPKGWLFRSINRKTKRLESSRLAQANAYAMVKRRAKAASIKTEINNHTFRATGITAYLTNNGTLEKAAKMANHASTRTTQLYDRRSDEIILSEVERIRF